MKQRQAIKRNRIIFTPSNACGGKKKGSNCNIVELPTMKKENA